MKAAWDKSSYIRKIQILCKQKSFLALRGIPNFQIRVPHQAFFENCVNIVPQAAERRTQTTRKILVQLKFHRMRGVSAVGMSSAAEAAAKTMAACMSSRLRLGNAARISSGESP
jgi:hypothetical protein